MYVIEYLFCMECYQYWSVIGVHANYTQIDCIMHYNTTMCKSFDDSKQAFIQSDIIVKNTYKMEF